MHETTSTDASFRALSHIASNVSAPVADRRDYRYERRTALQKITWLTRLKKCGNTPISSAAVEIGITTGVAHFRNVATCGSVWACPVCSAKILGARSIEIAEAIRRWTSLDGSFAFETLTMSHHSRTGLKAAIRALAKAFTATNAGRSSAVHKSFGQVGYLKSVEVTHGVNGWHVHLHILRFLDHWLDDSEIENWSQLIYSKWSTSMVNQGFARPSRMAQDMHMVKIGENMDGYFTKAFDNPRELASEALTASTAHGRTPWQLLDSALADESGKDMQLWHEYERATKGTRQVAWSKDLRAMLEMAATESDQELASATPPFEPLMRIMRRSVRKMGGLGWVVSRVLRLIERGDMASAVALFEEHGVEFELTPAGVELMPQKPS
jgi:Replication protein